jgi:tetratricopeptide (TPR) repeat protein
MSGDYEEARRTYAGLVARDSTDVFALVLQGAVEYNDPWLAAGADGTLAPRSNLNTAVRAFRRTVDLSPGFHLGYGHLFDITEMVVEGARPESGAKGFLPPSDERFPPWEQMAPFDMVAFHPVLLDSMVWVPASDWEEVEHARAAEGASALLDQSMRALRRWSEWAPDEPRPLRELAHWTLWRREQLTGTTRGAEADSLASEALGFEARALALLGDTTAGDWFRLASLRLASGDAEGAVDATERGLSGGGEGEERGVPRSTLNPLMAAGRASRALEVADRVDLSVIYPTDPETGRPFGDGGVAPRFSRLEILGAMGVTGSPVEAELDAIRTAWSSVEFTDAQRRALHRVYLFDTWPVLIDAPGYRSEWREAAGGTDPIWSVLADSPEEAAAAYAAARDHPRPEVLGALRWMTLGIAARRLGRDQEAIDYLTRVVEAVPSVQSQDRRWALAARARTIRAEAYLALGIRDRAREDLEWFQSAWDRDDPLTEPSRERAGRGLASVPPM